MLAFFDKNTCYSINPFVTFL